VLFIRSMLFNILMVVTVPFVLIPGLFTLPFSFKVRYRVYSSWSLGMMWLVEKLCGLGYEVQGAENIPAGACIIYSKHQSTWETIALQKIFPPQVWVLKRELLWVPFFGWALAMLGVVAINRSSGRKAVKQIAELGKQRLEQGKCVVIFPEGTRVAPGVEKRFGVGGAILAQHSQYPLVPVCHNAGEYWPRRGIIKKPGTIKVVIGKPIDPTGRKAEDMNAEIKQWMEAVYKEITTMEFDSESGAPAGVS